jgi:predicted HAD superfamily Cof-like phosphohydrolase
MTSNNKKVKTFMEAFGQEVKLTPEFPDKATQDLRIELIREELQELIDAINDNDIVEVADALTDILYVTYGAGHAFGIDLDVCFDEVQRSNMSKLGADGNPIYREDGKIMKGENYFPPDLRKVVDCTKNC